MDSKTVSLSVCNYLLKHKESMDAKFVFPNEENKEFIAHKAVLAAWSPVFQAMFFGELKETDQVEIVDIKSSVFQKLIQALYAQPPTFNSIDEAVELYIAADKYDISMIAPIIDKYLVSILTVPVCCEVFDVASQYSLPKAKAKSNEMMMNYTKEVIEGDAFITGATVNTVNHICAMDRMIGASELDLYKAVETWQKKQGIKVDEIRPALENIRFLSIPHAEVCKMKLLTSDEKIAIILNSLENGSNEIPLPNNFSTAKTARWTHSTNLTSPKSSNAFTFALGSNLKSTQSGGFVFKSPAKSCKN